MTLFCGQICIGLAEVGGPTLPLDESHHGEEWQIAGNEDGKYTLLTLSGLGKKMATRCAWPEVVILEKLRGELDKNLGRLWRQFPVV